MATAVFDVLDFPAGIIPTGEVTHADDEALGDEATWKTGSKFDHELFADSNLLMKIMRKAAASSVGLRVSVQAVALPNQEELCLRLMMEIERCQHK